MRRFSGIFIGLLCAAPPAFAQDTNSALHDAMAVLPEQVFMQTNTGLAHFVDLSAQAARGSEQAPGLAWLQRSPAVDLRPVASLAEASMRGSTEEWAQKAGTDVDTLSYFAGYGVPPNVVTIWGFTDEAAANAAFAGLAERGFTEMEGMPGVLANGEPMQVNLMSRDPASPWSGMMGETSVVTQMGSHFLHASGPDAFAPSLQDQPAMIDSAPGKTLLAALEAQGKPVAQASFFSLALGLSAADPGAVLGTTSPAEAKATMEAAAANAAEGVPPYFGGVMADLVEDGKSVAVIALAYPDCATAEAAAAGAAALWPKGGVYPENVTVTASHVDAGAPGCAAVLTVESPESDPSNYQMAVGGIFRRDLASIRVTP